MNPPGRSRMRPWMLMVGAIGLVAGHSVVLSYGLSHAALSTAVLSGVIVVVVIKHLGLPVSVRRGQASISGEG